MALLPVNTPSLPSFSLFFSLSSFSPSLIPSATWFTSLSMLHLMVKAVLSSCRQGHGLMAPQMQSFDMTFWHDLVGIIHNIVDTTYCDETSLIPFRQLYGYSKAVCGMIRQLTSIVSPDSSQVNLVWRPTPKSLLMAESVGLLVSYSNTCLSAWRFKLVIVYSHSDCNESISGVECCTLTVSFSVKTSCVQHSSASCCEYCPCLFCSAN